jgi:5-formyltetrahydrofolate cyclo-ligase
MPSKLELRKCFLQKRADLKQNFKADASKKVSEKLIDFFSDESNPKVIACYISDNDEVCINKFIIWALNNGITIVLPRYNPKSKVASYEFVEVTNLDEDLKSGKYGILEPKESCRKFPTKELFSIYWLVPGVAFDNKCARLGRGKGIYDQVLDYYGGMSIGVFYECQKTECIPMDKHDKFLDFIVTEEGMYKKLKEMEC